MSHKNSRFTMLAKQKLRDSISELNQILKDDESESDLCEDIADWLEMCEFKYPNMLIRYAFERYAHSLITSNDLEITNETFYLSPECTVITLKIGYFNNDLTYVKSSLNNEATEGVFYKGKEVLPLSQYYGSIQDNKTALAKFLDFYSKAEDTARDAQSLTELDKEILEYIIKKGFMAYINDKKKGCFILM